jgi:hypothetical protein
VVVIVEVSAVAGRPPAAAPVVVQVRDTSLADAPATVLAEARGQVRGELGSWLDTVEIGLPAGTAGRDTTVWAHVDVDGDGRVSRGDFVTTASHPVPPGDEVRVAVGVRQVG